MMTLGIVGVSKGDPLTTPYYASTPDQYNVSQKKAINAFIAGLRADASLGLFDEIAIFAAPSSPSARVDLFHPSAVMGVLATPGFTPNKGFTGHPLTGWLIDTTPTVFSGSKFTPANGHMGVFLIDGAGMAFATDSGFTGDILFFPNTTTGYGYVGGSYTGSAEGANVGNSAWLLNTDDTYQANGLFQNGARRIASGGAFKNNTTTQMTITAMANGSYGGTKLAVFHRGAKFATLEAVTKFHDRLVTLMADLGVIDLVPNAFTFADMPSAPPTTEVQSAPITVAGLTDGKTAPITVTGGKYSVNGGTPTSAPGVIYNGWQVRAVHTTGAGLSAVTETTVTIGGVSDTFTTTTYATPQKVSNTPAGYSYSDPNGVGGTSYGWDTVNRRFTANFSDPYQEASAFAQLQNLVVGSNTITFTRGGSAPVPLVQTSGNYTQGRSSTATSITFPYDGSPIANWRVQLRIPAYGGFVEMTN